LKIIAHISDLHFGKVSKTVADTFAADLISINPDIIVVSGDLTQRARKKEFQNASEFLKQFPQPKIIVPGNHDIPLFDLFRRLFFPLKRYTQYVTTDLNPYYEDEEISILGINTARSLTWKNGRISLEQIKFIQNTLCKQDEKIKVIVTHHPFIPPPGNPGIKLVGRSVKALEAIEKCSIDLLLAGHLHHGYNGDIRPFYPTRNRSIISIQAGTAISNRTRSEPNAYNVISISKTEIYIQIREFKDGKFTPALKSTYNKTEDQWVLQQ
jgi:3',5'-cyclic AMP phosphodiesterase CpdA